MFEGQAHHLPTSSSIRMPKIISCFKIECCLQKCGMVCGRVSCVQMFLQKTCGSCREYRALVFTCQFQLLLSPIVIWSYCSYWRFLGLCCGRFFRRGRRSRSTVVSHRTLDGCSSCSRLCWISSWKNRRSGCGIGQGQAKDERAMVTASHRLPDHTVAHGRHEALRYHEIVESPIATGKIE